MATTHRLPQPHAPATIVPRGALPPAAVGMLTVPLVVLVFVFVMLFEAIHDALPTRRKLRYEPFWPQ